MHDAKLNITRTLSERLFCGSKASAEQTLEHIVPYIEKKLFLKVNREKTVVASAGKIKFLGYGFHKGKKGFALRVHAKSKAKMRKQGSGNSPAEER